MEVDEQRPADTANNPFVLHGDVDPDRVHCARKKAPANSAIRSCRSFGATVAAIFVCASFLFLPGHAWAQAGLVAAYTFNEGAGSTLSDVSGNGNTGTIRRAIWTTAGKFGNALVFNGKNARVTVPNSTSLRLTTGMTLEAWVFPTKTPTDWRSIVDKNVDGYYLMASTNVGNRPAVGGTWTGGNQNTVGPSVLAANTWTHLAATFDGATVRLFVNGVQVVSQVQPTPLATTTGTLQIGGNSYGEYFAGRIDEVRIYNRALSVAEIQTDMNTPVGGTPTPDTSAPSAPAGLGATTASPSQINLAWSASTDNVGVTGYRVERCQGAGCTGFAQVATPTSTSFNDIGLTAATSYSYRVRAVDTAGNLGAYSNIVAATTSSVSTPDTTAPTVGVSSPLAGSTVSSTTTITASATDNVGVVGVQFLLDGTSLGLEQTGPFSLAWNTTSASNGTHTLSARARDAAGNTATATNVTVTVANTPVTGGLVAAYTFNEGAGSTVADVSGNGNTGTIGGASWTTAGKFGNALTFNGTSSQVTVPNSTSLRLTTAMTLEAWVYPTTAPTGWRSVIAKNVDAYYLMASSTVSNRPAAGGTWTAGNQNTIGASTLATNTWTHMAATFDGATVRLFVNGAQVASQAQTTTLAPSTGTLQIGADSFATDYFAGRIDEVRIYNRALSAAEIQSDMNTAVGGVPVPDTSAPTISSTSPSDAANGVPLNSSVSATFSELMTNSTLSTASFSLKATSGGAAVTGTVNVSGNTATFKPTAALAGNTQYTATITSAAKDAAGNALAANYIWSFTTAATLDTTPPTVSSTSPVNGATGMALNSPVSATFSEPMTNSTLSTASFTLRATSSGATITGTVNVSGNTATFTPSASLAGSTQYTATITTAAKDAAGNAMAANYTWQFTTAAAALPGTAVLSWDAVTATNLSGYRIYYGMAPGTYFQPLGQGINVGNVTTYTVTGLTSGIRYYYVATSVSTSNIESTFSNEVFKDMP